MATFVVAAEALHLYLAIVIEPHRVATYLIGEINPPATLALLSLALVGGLIVRRQPGNRIGWLLLLQAVTAQAAFQLSIDYAAIGAYLWTGLPSPTGVLAIGQALPAMVFALFLVALPALFPDGHLVSGSWYWRAALVVAGLSALISFAGSVLDPTALGPFHAQNPLGVGNFRGFTENLNNLTFIAFLPAAIVAWVSLAVRYRHRDQEQRHQIKWLLAALIFVIAAFATNQQQGPLLPLAIATLPVSIGVAILRYRLYDIDVVISRTLVYGSLAALITAVYVSIVVGVGSLIGSGGKPNLGLSILATAVVAVGFQPVRERLQRFANRLVYGKRATPYEVLAQFSENVAETYAAEEVLPRMARVLGEGTAAQRAEVWLRVEDELRPTAAWPEGANGFSRVRVIGQLLPELPDVDRAVAVLHQGELLGALSVKKRAGESLTPIEEKLVSDLAHQAGLVLKNVRLTSELLQRLDDLRESRQRLVRAQDEERRKLERNLQDGAQQNLVALKVKLGLAEMMADRDPAKAIALIQELKSETDETLETLRDLARGIYPPLLADKGLKAALEAQARKATLPVTVQAESIGRYPQDIEAAVYFCVLEALQNVQKYARATHATLRLSENRDNLGFEVEDDGKGFEAKTTARGAGLTNITDRLNALGGTMAIESTPGAGTRISGSIPTTSAVSR